MHLEHFDLISWACSYFRPGTNYFEARKNSGFVEGLNNKIKVMKRRCYGFFKSESYFQRLFLDLKGYSVYAN